MPIRIPNPFSPEEVRRAFEQHGSRVQVLDQGTTGQVLIGQGVGVLPIWTTELTALTKITVDNITIDAAIVSSDTGAISFADENLTTTGSVTAESFATGTLTLDAASITDSSGAISFGNENLSTTGSVTAESFITGTLTLDAATITDSSGTISFDDENLTTTGSITGANVTSGADPGHTHSIYLNKNGTVQLTGDWTTGAFSFIGSEHWYLRADGKKMFFGTGNDASLYYSGSHFIFDSQETGGGDFYFNNGNMYLSADNQKIILGTGLDAAIYYNGSHLIIDPQEVGSGNVYISSGKFGVGLAPTALIDARQVEEDTTADIYSVRIVTWYGSAGSGDMGNDVYGLYFDCRTDANYDGDFTGTAYIAALNGMAAHSGSGTLAKMFGGRFQVHIVSGGGNVTAAYGVRIYATDSSSVGAYSSLYGLYIEDINLGSGSNNWAIYTKEGYVYHEDNVGINVAYPSEKLMVRGNIFQEDNHKSIYGTGKDAAIYYNATDLIIDPDEAGSGKVLIGATADDEIDAGSYSVGGAAGATGTFTTVDGKTVTVTNGIIVSIV
jgi:hypothetical protein